MARTGGLRAKRKGDVGEAQAHELLMLMGARMLQKISTPVIINPPRDPRLKNMFFKQWLFWGKKVKGDRWGIEPETGRSILVEVKYHEEDRLQHHILKAHQVEALNEHSSCNGLTFLVWVHPTDIFVLKWPIPEFHRGTSLSIERAFQLKVDRII